MLMFAWILWGLYIVGYAFMLLVTILTIIAINKGRKVRININPITTLLNIAVFVFLNLYLFT